jgi:L-ribulose-5-phosphate 4-epimerase
MLLKNLREEVLETALRMLSDGIAHGSQGNVSALDRESGLIAITPSAVPYTEMKAEDVCVVDRERRVVEGRWKPTSEIALHMIFYEKRGDVGAVVHSHAPYCTVFAVTGQGLPSVLTEAASCLGGPVPLAPYRSPGSEELARVVFETAGDGPAALMAHHGLVTSGANLAQAYDATLAAETTARVVILARSMGLKEIPLDPLENVVMRSIYLLHYHPTLAAGEGEKE